MTAGSQGGGARSRRVRGSGGRTRPLRAWQLLARHISEDIVEDDQALERALLHARNAGDVGEQVEIYWQVGFNLARGPTHIEKAIQRCREILAETEGNRTTRRRCSMPSGTSWLAEERSTRRWSSLPDVATSIGRTAPCGPIGGALRSRGTSRRWPASLRKRWRSSLKAYEHIEQMGALLRSGRRGWHSLSTRSNASTKPNIGRR